MPNRLTPAQKVMRTELAQSMLQALAKHEHMSYHFLFTGDESWMFYTDDPRTSGLLLGTILKKLSDGHISIREPLHYFLL
jgi:hypothetical protein